MTIVFYQIHDKEALLNIYDKVFFNLCYMVVFKTCRNLETIVSWWKYALQFELDTKLIEIF